MRILYEWRWRKANIIEADHIHLDCGSAIYYNEMIRLPFGIAISKYSMRKDIIKIHKGFKKVFKKLKKWGIK